MNSIIGIVLVILLFVIIWRIEKLAKFIDNSLECRNTLYPVFSKTSILKQQARIDLSQTHKEYQEARKERKILNSMIETNIAVLNGADLEQEYVDWEENH